MEGAIKKNADAELAFNTAHSLILKLAQHKAKASPDPPQVSLFKTKYIFTILYKDLYQVQEKWKFFFLTQI